jgi:lipid-binding SYLF domain-containing protein
MIARAFQRVVLVLVTAGLALAGWARAEEPAKGSGKKVSEAQQLVIDAGKTFERFLQDPNLSWFREHKGEALAYLIAPKVVKAGFIFGGSGGHAVLVVKGEKGWAGPAFYSVGTASVGFQAGVTVVEAVALVMTQKGLDSLMSQSLKLGADASVAVGPVGVGAGATGVTDFIIYTRSKGLYGGVNVEGSIVRPSEDFNKAYYGQAVSPIDIVVKGTVKHNSAADAPLLAKIAKEAPAAK